MRLWSDTTGRDAGKKNSLKLDNERQGYYAWHASAAIADWYASHALKKLCPTLPLIWLWLVALIAP